MVTNRKFIYGNNYDLNHINQNSINYYFDNIHPFINRTIFYNDENINNEENTDVQTVHNDFTDLRDIQHDKLIYKRIIDSEMNQYDVNKIFLIEPLKYYKNFINYPYPF